MRLSLFATLAAAGLLIASATAVGCDGDDDHDHGTSGGHTSKFPACNEITQACHEVDTGDGPIHDCHDKAHAATAESDCTPIKDDCLRICAEAKADAGAGDAGDEDAGGDAGGGEAGADGGDGGDGG